MKKSYTLGVAAVVLAALLASCTTTKAPVENIPTAPEAVPSAPAAVQEPAAPEAAPAPVAEPAPAPAPVIEQPAEQPAPAPVAEPAPVVKEPTLEEKIDAADDTITLDEAFAIATALTDPANDPDGRLTAKALVKADAIVTDLINNATSEEEVDGYLALIDEGLKEYGDYVKALGIDVQPYIDLLQERKVAIEAYYKDSYYYYLKQYRKDGHYKKELARLLNEKHNGK